MGLPTKADPFIPVRTQREQADTASRAERAAEQQRIRDLRAAMQHRETRALLRWVLSLRKPSGADLCPLHGTFDSNAMQMARNEGRREILADVWQELAQHAPVELALLQQEGKEP